MDGLNPLKSGLRSERDNAPIGGGKRVLIPSSRVFGQNSFIRLDEEKNRLS